MNTGLTPLFAQWGSRIGRIEPSLSGSLLSNQPDPPEWPGPRSQSIPRLIARAIQKLPARTIQGRGRYAHLMRLRAVVPMLWRINPALPEQAESPLGYLPRGLGAG